MKTSEQRHEVIVRTRSPKGRKGAGIVGFATIVTNGKSAFLTITQRFWIRSTILGILVSFALKSTGEHLVKAVVGTVIIFPSLPVSIMLFYWLVTKQHVLSIGLDENKVLFDPKLKVVFFKMANEKWIAAKDKAHPERFFNDIISFH